MKINKNVYLQKGQLPSKPFLYCTIKLAFTFSCCLRSVLIPSWFVFTLPTNCHIALHTCAHNHKPNTACISIMYRVDSFVICTTNVENGRLTLNKKTNAANHNDGISKKEKSSGSAQRISSWVKQSVVESSIDTSVDCIMPSTSTASIPVEMLPTESKSTSPALSFKILSILTFSKN